MSPEQQRLHALEIDKLSADLEQMRAERDQLRQHILDIDAHATPYGDIPDDPGYVGTYLLSAGALHRALGKIGHTAPKCEAEAQLAEARAELTELKLVLSKESREFNVRKWRELTEQRDEARAELATLRAELAKCVERLDDDAWERLEAERDRYREHSKALNAIGFAAALALGDVPPGADQIRGYPLDQIRRLLDLANPSWVREDNLSRAHAHLAHTIAKLAAEPGGTEMRECPGQPLTPGVPDDGLHCECWRDGGACCRCKAPAEPSGETGLDPNAPPTGRTRCPLCNTLPIGHEGECEP